MLMAATGDQILAGRIVLLYRGTAYDWYAGSTPQGKRLHADEWLVWRAMLLAKEHRAVRFDFGGAGEPDQDYGPREFKRRFGGPITNIGRYTKVLRRVRDGLVWASDVGLGGSLWASFFLVGGPLPSIFFRNLLKCSFMVGINFLWARGGGAGR